MLFTDFSKRFKVGRFDVIVDSTVLKKDFALVNITHGLDQSEWEIYDENMVLQKEELKVKNDVFENLWNNGYIHEIKMEKEKKYKKNLYEIGEPVLYLNVPGFIISAMWNYDDEEWTYDIMSIEADHKLWEEQDISEKNIKKVENGIAEGTVDINKKLYRLKIEKTK